jgi:hypothetical protein
MSFNKILALFNLRVIALSSWREQRRYDSLATSVPAQKRILNLAKFLAPRHAVGQRKIRVGSRYDGGYVCLDDFAEISAAFSFGIGQDDHWDVDIADRGIIVYQFDHTVQSPPRLHTNCRFYRKKIVAVKDSESVESISSLVANLSEVGLASIVLKIDIEHNEWQVLLSTPREDLCKFRQIICEFHGFDKIEDNEWYQQALAVLEKLNLDHQVVHVHGNNYAPWIIVGGVPFPGLLEVTYANRSCYSFGSTDESFPISLDAPNVPDKPDLRLGRFML